MKEDNPSQEEERKKAEATAKHETKTSFYSPYLLQFYRGWEIQQ